MDTAAEAPLSAKLHDIAARSGNTNRRSMF